MNEHRPNPATDRDRLIDVDEARERPRSVEQLTDIPDTGKLTDSPDETTPDHDDDSIVPGDSADVYERGTTIIPPG
jgi:hypothetical protein